MRFIRSLKLEDFCLQVIVENLEKFIYNQNVPKKHIDFLLRLYAEELFRPFISKHKITEETMLWFLNPYSKNITLRTSSAKIAEQLEVVGPTITSLSLCDSYEHVTENMINSIICCIPNVTHLDLSRSLCSHRTLLYVQKMCPYLITLILLSCNQIHNDGMLNLCGGDLSLKNLNVYGTSVRSDGLHAILKGMPSLQSVKMRDMARTLYSIHEWDLKKSDVNICYNLTELNFDSQYCFALDVLHGWTVMCPKVTKVHINVPSSKRMYEMCTKFQHLTDLKIELDATGSFLGESGYSEDEFDSDEDTSEEEVNDPMHLKYIDCTGILASFLVRASSPPLVFF